GKSSKAACGGGSWSGSDKVVQNLAIKFWHDGLRFVGLTAGYRERRAAGQGIAMLVRVAFVAACLCVVSPSFAEPLNADAARRFVVGKMFGFQCFDGSRGEGRIYSDGSVIGTIQMQGSGAVRS